MTFASIRRFLVIMTALAVAPAAGATQELGKDPRVRQALTFVEMWLDGQRTYEAIPGVSAAVVHDQQVIWSGASGQTSTAPPCVRGRAAPT